ncbi:MULTISPECIES: ISL3 family transposase [unclassified Microcoleus]|uniref:ISL3 family transposase n=1 Tax=unclassified Microcoleus TaxID=2642155 RepID=UPI002FD1FE00
MTTKKGTKFLTELLNIQGIKVTQMTQVPYIGIILQVESIHKESHCHRCGTKSNRLHQNHRYLVKDFSWGEKLVFLEINRRQFKCKKCGKPFSEKLDFVNNRRTYTKRLADTIIKSVLSSDINNVAKEGVVTTEEIERMLSDASQELSSKPSGLKKLGIDEIALTKGQGNYCAVLTDLSTSKLITIIKGRKQEDIEPVLNSWGLEVLEQIEEVSIDLWKGYKTLVEKLMPNAQVVADRFHVMVQVNKELDRERKRERREIIDLSNKSKSPQRIAEYKEILDGLNGSKYALLKNEESLKEKQKSKLMSVKKVCPRLAIMHKLKEEFRQIFENRKTNWLRALLRIGSWQQRAKKYFSSTVNTITNWIEEIIAYFDNRTTSGAVEGVNNKLKLIKRSAYGFRNFENYKNRCLLTWHFNC